LFYRDISDADYDSTIHTGKTSRTRPGGITCPESDDHAGSAVSLESHVLVAGLWPYAVT
jgi:hypothetical protein